MDQKPRNVVLICSDQHNRHMAGCYGNPHVITPHMDALAAAGPAYSGAVEDIAAHEIPIGTFQSYPHQGGFDGHFCARFIRI